MTGSSDGAVVALVCSAPDCGLRYPSPVDDPRFGTCPRCEQPTQVGGTYPPPRTDTDPAARSGRVVAVLDSIRSALNVGTMLRSADGASLDHVHLCGLTPDIDNPKVVKTALSSERLVATTHHRDVTTCVAALIADGYEMWAIERTQVSRPLHETGDLPDRLAFVVGNERAGVDPAVLEVADRHLHLPMYGSKTTLNVGVAFGIVAYALVSSTGLGDARRPS